MAIPRIIPRHRKYKFRQEMLILYFAIRDGQTPLHTKIPAILSVLYLLSPVDLIPDFIPFIGYLDDLVIVPLLLHLSFFLLPESVRERSLLKAKKQTGKFRVAIIIVLLVVAALMAGFFFLGRSLLHS